MMLPRLVLSAAVVSLACLVLAHEHQNAKVRRAYHFRNADEGFDLVSEVIQREYALYGVESSFEQRASVATVRTSRRAHAAITSGLLANRCGLPATAAV